MGKRPISSRHVNRAAHGRYPPGNNLFFPLMAGGTAILPSDLLLPTVLGELAPDGATVLVAGPWSLGAIARLVRPRAHREATRRLRLVLESLPRNEPGKLTRESFERP